MVFPNGLEGFSERTLNGLFFRYVRGMGKKVRDLRKTERTERTLHITFIYFSSREGQKRKVYKGSVQSPFTPFGPVRNNLIKGGSGDGLAGVSRLGSAGRPRADPDRRRKPSRLAKGIFRYKGGDGWPMGVFFDLLRFTADNDDFLCYGYPKRRYSGILAAVGEKRDIYQMAHTCKTTLEAG